MSFLCFIEFYVTFGVYFSSDMRHVDLSHENAASLSLLHSELRGLGQNDWAVTSVTRLGYF